jgi:hypothetical protein
LDFSARKDGMPRARLLCVTAVARSSDRFAIDVVFEPNDAFRATVFAIGEQPPAAAPRRRPALWPLALCLFVAMASATAAFLMSPLASHPEVAPYANAFTAMLDQ